jgi:hypothetical protein
VGLERVTAGAARPGGRVPPARSEQQAYRSDRAVHVALTLQRVHRGAAGGERVVEQYEAPGRGRDGHAAHQHEGARAAAERALGARGQVTPWSLCSATSGMAEAAPWTSRTTIGVARSVGRASTTSVSIALRVSAMLGDRRGGRRRQVERARSSRGPYHPARLPSAR